MARKPSHWATNAAGRTHQGGRWEAERPRGTRRRKLALLTAVLVSMVLGATHAFAITAPNVFNFEVEGDLRSGTSFGGGDDWAQGSSGLGVLIPAPGQPTNGTVAPLDNPAEPGKAFALRDKIAAEGSNADDALITNNKETDFQDSNGDGLADDPSITDWSIGLGQVPPSKDDLSYVYLYHDLANRNNVVYMAFERTNILGTSHVDFEFNHLDTVPCPSNPATRCPQRTNGDVLIAFDITNGGAVVTPRLFLWDTSDWPTTPQEQREYPWRESAVNLSDKIIATTNADPNGIPAGPWGSVDSKGASRSTIPQFGFFEIAADFGALGLAIGCPGFATLQVKSRSAAAIDADLKDYGVLSIELDHCGSISGQKFHDLNADGVKDAGEPGLSGWEIHLFGTTDDGASVHDHTTTDANGNYSFPKVLRGSYTVCETLQVDWTQSFPTAGAGTVSCVGHSGGGGGAPVGLGY
ncbi:MAG: hypothetical protein HY689_03170, partial [Chloroflexi bacterium]|nr:hypothetical protein [Chloroflexota bacterium]